MLTSIRKPIPEWLERVSSARPAQLAPKERPVENGQGACGESRHGRFGQTTDSSSPGLTRDSSCSNYGTCHLVRKNLPQFLVRLTDSGCRHNLYATSTHPPACLAYPPQYAAMNVWPTQSGVASPTAVCAPIMSYTSSAQPYLPSTAHAQSTAPSAHYRPQQHGKNGPPPPSTSSLPVRQINDGTTILLSGLHSNQSENELRNLLRRFGEVVYLEIHPDSRNPSKTKGSARARYHTSSDAIAAVRDLDGKYLRDRKINVKQERDEQPLMTTHSRSSLRETRNGNGPSTKSQKKIAILSSNSSSAKSHRPQDCSKGSGRGTERSGGTAKSTAGPLVVNGARKSESRHVRYSHHSDDSSEDDDSNEASSATSDDEKENVARVSPSVASDVL